MIRAVLDDVIGMGNAFQSAALVAGLPAAAPAALVSATFWLRFLRIVLRRRFAAVTAVHVQPSFKFLDPSLQPRHLLVQHHDQRIFLCAAEAGGIEGKRHAMMYSSRSRTVQSFGLSSHLKGIEGDAVHAILRGVGHNLRLLRDHVRALIPYFLRFWRESLRIVADWRYTASMAP